MFNGNNGSGNDKEKKEEKQKIIKFSTKDINKSRPKHKGHGYHVSSDGRGLFRITNPTPNEYPIKEYPSKVLMFIEGKNQAVRLRKLYRAGARITIDFDQLRRTGTTIITVIPKQTKTTTTKQRKIKPISFTAYSPEKMRNLSKEKSNKQYATFDFIVTDKEWKKAGKQTLTNRYIGQDKKPHYRKIHQGGDIRLDSFRKKHGRFSSIKQKAIKKFNTIERKIDTIRFKTSSTTISAGNEFLVDKSGRGVITINKTTGEKEQNPQRMMVLTTKAGQLAFSSFISQNNTSNFQLNIAELKKTGRTNITINGATYTLYHPNTHQYNNLSLPHTSQLYPISFNVSNSEWKAKTPINITNTTANTSIPRRIQVGNRIQSTSFRKYNDSVKSLSLERAKKIYRSFNRRIANRNLSEAEEDSEEDVSLQSNNHNQTTTTTTTTATTSKIPSSWQSMPTKKLPSIPSITSKQKSQTSNLSEAEEDSSVIEEETSTRPNNTNTSPDTSTSTSSTITLKR